ncbi:MAG: Ppx/GppA phosphatase, partial [Conexibacter sp.]|nr:Ppx/GppA phosphatase [Conexibacter sp.]
GAGALRVVATAAVRRAANGAEVCGALREAAGVEVELLDAVTEARLAFAGATRALVAGEVEPDAPLGVVDVGGGSSELVLGTRAIGVTWSTSLPFGSGDLAAAHLRSDPPAPAELAAIRERVAAAFAGLAATVAAALARPPVRVFAVGGSATSICRLVGRRLDGERLRRAVELLASAPAEELARDHDLDPVRVRLMPAGILVLAAAADLLGPLEVADGGLREGVVLELAAR